MTEHFATLRSMAAIDDAAQLERIAAWLRDARSIVVLTGAGISTESGVPDFRGPQGIWTKDPSAEKTATLAHYMSDRDARVRSWRNRMDGGWWLKEPNAGHVALAELERKAALDLLVTQNVDGLHQKAGTSPERVVEIHGTMTAVQCMRCGERGALEATLDRVRAGEDDPPCRSCGGILKSATISFGQSLVPEDLERSFEAAAGCDVFLALGTSLGVYPAAEMPAIALRSGAVLVIGNAQETPYDGSADAIRRDQLGTWLPAAVALI